VADEPPSDAQSSLASSNPAVAAGQTRSSLASSNPAVAAGQTCPECGGPFDVWLDDPDGIRVAFLCDNPECKSGQRNANAIRISLARPDRGGGRWTDGPPSESLNVVPGDLCRAMLHDDTAALAAAIRTWCGSRLEVTEVRQGLEALVVRLSDGS
jgi:hypothetical protein